MLQLFTLLGALGMFLYGMNLMSSGHGITALIQSSSATTVMVVSFVNAGLLTLVQAIGVIMGANISILAVPLMLLGFLL